MATSDKIRSIVTETLSGPVPAHQTVLDRFSVEYIIFNQHAFQENRYSNMLWMAALHGTARAVQWHVFPGQCVMTESPGKRPLIQGNSLYACHEWHGSLLTLLARVSLATQRVNF